MDSSLPLVSIITPSFNQARYLEQTIQSVLWQDYPNLEYLIVDGGSSDGSLEIIQHYADRLAWWVSEPDKGQANAINKGILHAKGQIIGWVNSDDLYFRQETVNEAVKAFRSHPEIGMVYANGLKISADGTLIDWFYYPQYDLKDLLSFKVLLQPASFMRSTALQEAGYLPEGSNLLLDHELWIQIAARYPILHVEGFWAVERSHESAKTISLAADYGPDAFVLLEQLGENPLFRPTIEQNYHQILAGIHVFHGRRLIDANQPKQALISFWQAARLHPTSVARVWFKLLQAVVDLFGLGGVLTSTRNALRRARNKPHRLIVGPTGVYIQRI